MNYMKIIDTNLDKNLAVLHNPLVSGVIHMLLVLYAARLAPELPPVVTRLFSNQYFKLIIFALILWTARVSPSMSILIALCFMVSLNVVNKQPIWEFLENTPQAPTSNVAISAAQGSVESQMASPASVTGMQTQAPIIIQPSVQQTTAGPVVMQPSIVLAPAVVSTPSGNVIVPPKVSTVSIDTTTSQVTTTGAPITTTAAPVTTTGAPEKVVQASKTETEGCYPMRNYDMSKVEASTWADRSGKGSFETYQLWSS